MRAGLLFVFLIWAGALSGQTLSLDSSMERYYAPIADTVVIAERPAATRLYCFVTTDLLYGACSIVWQLCYTEEGTTYTLRTGQVQMAGDAYIAYSLNNRSIVDLFTYAGAAVGVTFVP